MKLDLVPRGPGAAPAAVAAVRIVALLPGELHCRTEVTGERLRLRIDTTQSVQTVGEMVQTAVRNSALRDWRLCEVER